MALTEGRGATGTPDVTVVIDERTLRQGRRHAGSIVDCGLGRFGLPIETIRRWACLATVTPVVVAADGVHIMLGRQQRLANRAQRRALRVLYRTCALCEVPFEHTHAEPAKHTARTGGQRAPPSTAIYDVPIGAMTAPRTATRSSEIGRAHV